MEASQRSKRTNLYVFYLFLFILGCALVVIGVLYRWYIVEDDEIAPKFLAIDEDHEDFYTYMAYARIGAGALTILLAVQGFFCCVPGLKKGFVAGYVILVALWIAGEIAVIVLSFLYYDEAIDDKEIEMQVSNCYYRAVQIFNFYELSEIEYGIRITF